MEYIERIGVEEETIITIGIFAILWPSFEKKFFKNVTSEQKLADFSEKINGKKIPLDLSKDIIKGLAILNKSYLNIEIFKGIKTIEESLEITRKTRKRIILNSDEFDKCTHDEIFFTALFIIYRVRNQLFHGLKNEWKLDSQVDFFKSVNLLLDYCLTKINPPIQ